jgi:2-polyprenyl-3-methyl-5-hydroxy-6-metoxy-1,4-benzoquinol methylase
VTRANAILESFQSAIKPNSTIIDIGAGKGLLAEAMMSDAGLKIEHSETMSKRIT